MQLIQTVLPKCQWLLLLKASPRVYEDRVAHPFTRGYMVPSPPVSVLKEDTVSFQSHLHRVSQ